VGGLGRFPKAAPPGDPHCTTLVEHGTIKNMPARIRTPSRKSQPKPIRQSVTIPGSLAAEVRRVAKQRHLTISRALVSLAERGVQAEVDARQNLNATYERFMKEREPDRKEEAGKDLIRAIFGKEGIAEDTVL
jgi:hypothetical protein